MVFEDSLSIDRRLWLEKVLGYWTETLVTVEACPKLDTEEERDSFRMWLKTDTLGQTWLQGSVPDEGAPGALGVEWRYDGEFSFRVIN